MNNARIYVGDEPFDRFANEIDDMPRLKRALRVILQMQRFGYRTLYISGQVIDLANEHMTW